MADKDLILKIMATLLTAYPSAPRTDEDLKILRALWCDVLEDVPDDALQAAAREYTRSAATFAPLPGQLREIAQKYATRKIYAQIEQRQALRLTEHTYTATEIDNWVATERTRYAAQCASDEMYTAGLRELGKTLDQWQQAT